MQVILLAIVTFILAIDQYSLTELLSRPIIACTIFGLILGDLKIGLSVGGALELLMIGNMPVGGAQPPNAVIAGLAAVILSIQANLAVSEALGACMIFALFGQYAVTLTFTFMSYFMKKADKAAAEANPKGIRNVNLVSALILGTLFAILSVIFYYGGAALGTVLQTYKEQLSWLMGGLGVAGNMMRYVGFAVLLRIMLAGDMWGIYFAGFATAAILGNIPATSSATLLLVAFIGAAIAIYDYNTGLKIKESGGSSDGI